jgi:hypothetical protein
VWAQQLEEGVAQAEEAGHEGAQHDAAEVEAQHAGEGLAVVRGEVEVVVYGVARNDEVD